MNKSIVFLLIFVCLFVTQVSAIEPINYTCDTDSVATCSNGFDNNFATYIECDNGNPFSCGTTSVVSNYNVTAYSGFSLRADFSYRISVTGPVTNSPISCLLSNGSETILARLNTAALIAENISVFIPDACKINNNLRITSPAAGYNSIFRYTNLIEQNLTALSYSIAPSALSITNFGCTNLVSGSFPSSANDSNFSTSYLYNCPGATSGSPASWGQRFDIINFTNLNLNNASNLVLKIAVNKSNSTSPSNFFMDDAIVYFLNSTNSYVPLKTGGADTGSSSGNLFNFTFTLSNLGRVNSLSNLVLKVNGSTAFTGAGIYTGNIINETNQIGITEIWLEYVTDSSQPNAPVINLTNNSVINSTAPSRSYNFQVNNSDNSAVGQCFYSLNGGANTTYSCSNGVYSTATVTNIPSGSNTLRFYTMNDAGLISSNSTSFIFYMYGMGVNNVSYLGSAYETSNSTFTLNLTYDTSLYTTSSANLIYNGTSYSTPQTISGSNSIFTRSINLPIVRNTTGNYDINSFYFEVLLSNSTTTSYFNSSTYTQQVDKTDIVICNLTYQNFSLINFTTKSATSPYPNKNATMRITWDWNLGIGAASVQRNSSYQDLSEGNYTWAFCGTVNANYTIDAQIQYDATGYALNNYYLDDALVVPNQTSSINLYLLNDSLATLTEFLVQNPAQQGIENVLIQVQMYDVGLDQFFLVSMMRTSYAGTDISYLNWYDTFYKYILIQDGEVIYSTNSSKISDTPQTFTIFPDTVFTFDKFRDFQYSLTFNNATQNFVLTYTKPSGLVTAACLRVIKRTIGNDTTLSTQCNGAASGTIYYNIANDGNGTFIASFYATGSIYPIDWITATIGEGLSDAINFLLGDDAPVYAILFAAVTLGATFFNPIFGVIAIVLSILGAGALGFAPISYGTYIGIVLIGGIIILFIRR